MEASKDVPNSSVIILPEETIVHCPSCDVAMKPYDVAKHYEKEIDELKQLSHKINSIEAAEQQLAGTHMQNGESSDTRKPWSVFRRVQKNRQTRLKRRSRKRQIIKSSCPICSLTFSQDEIHRHTEQCLRQNKGTGFNVIGDNANEDSEDGAEYEEYEWAGQKRIRASSLLQGGYGSLGLATIMKQSADDDEEDLNVDEDDTQIYGPPQYGESDVIPPTVGNNGLDPEEYNVATYMRQLIGGTNMSTDANLSAPKIERTNPQTNTETPSINKENIEKDKCQSHSSNHNLELSFLGKSHSQIVESLKAKLRHYENHIQSKFKCLICLDDYRNPAISVSCWHVHCEECWLRSLGARKLCPQCNLITSPRDLRRIYL